MYVRVCVCVCVCVCVYLQQERRKDRQKQKEKKDDLPSAVMQMNKLVLYTPVDSPLPPTSFPPALPPSLATQVHNLCIGPPP